MDIEGLGDEIVGRLVAAGMVSDVADFYRLELEALASLDMGRLKQDGTPVVLGPVVAEKILGNIEASKHAAARASALRARYPTRGLDRGRGARCRDPEHRRVAGVSCGDDSRRSKAWGR